MGFYIQLAIVEYFETYYPLLATLLALASGGMTASPILKPLFRFLGMCLFCLSCWFLIIGFIVPFVKDSQTTNMTGIALALALMWRCLGYFLGKKIFAHLYSQKIRSNIRVGS